MLLCFCNQKTAYDRRISDWSSDVCSSDLGLILCRLVRFLSPAAHVALRFSLSESPARPHRLFHWRGLSRDARSCAPHSLGRRAGPLSSRSRGDGQSEVEGQSVSVRVDLGGGRIIKKKNKP